MTEANGTAQAQIRQLLEAWAAAVRRHDMPAILAFHDPDIVMFDLPPPLQSKGLGDYEESWKLFFQYHKVSQAFDIEQLSIVTGGGAGFAFGHHALRRRRRSRGLPLPDHDRASLS